MGERALTGTKQWALEGRPACAGLGEAPTGHKGMDVRVGLELPAPRMQDPGATREVGAEETLVLGEALAGERRGVAHRVVREALRRAEKGT